MLTNLRTIENILQPTKIQRCEKTMQKSEMVSKEQLVPSNGRRVQRYHGSFWSGKKYQPKCHMDHGDEVETRSLEMEELATQQHPKREWGRRKEHLRKCHQLLGLLLETVRQWRKKGTSN